MHEKSGAWHPLCIALGQLALGACSSGSTDAPRWIHLARGFEPPPLERLLATGSDISLRPDGPGVWLEHSIQPEDWVADAARPDQWSARRPPTAGFRELAGGERAELQLGGRNLPAILPGQLSDTSIETGSGLFSPAEERIVLRLPSGEAPAGEALFSTYLERGERVGDVWRCMVRGRVADGLTLWPGERAEIECDVPPGCVLRLSTLACSFGSAGASNFRVSLDGEVLLDLRCEFGAGQEVEQSLELELPASGVARGRFLFEVSGDPAATAFLNPVIGPERIGARRERPWRDVRPDIVVVLLDTFRADNLAAYGGQGDVAPNLNALADASLRFLAARSTSVWTLPAHGSLFTGVLPTQHGAVLPGVTFPRELTTIAEHLAAHGYRTGAVTDSGYVSRTYGMDQGFEWFVENNLGSLRLADTLRSALDFLDRDDGRPVFLFVHTYRVHHPYRQGPEESEEALDALMERVAAALRERRNRDTTLEILSDFVDEYYGLYLDGVRALDAEIGPWLAELEARGLFDAGYLIVTSDHGEEFYEHQNRGHKGRPHEEKIRIPLLIRGAGLAPRDVRLGASLIDLPPTIADLCGLSTLETWIGRSLLELDRERPLFAYNREVSGTQAHLSIVDGDRKVFARADAELLEPDALMAAYDLENDPGEQRNLLEQDVEWPRGFIRTLAPVWAELDDCLGKTVDVQLSDELLERLRALGYGD